MSDFIIGDVLSYRDLYYQQEDNFWLLQNTLQLQRLEDERVRQHERLLMERQVINERKASFINRK